MTKVRVFVDTNVIVEAFRTNCWTALSQRYDLETVEECVNETQRGNPARSTYVLVELATLQSTLSKIHQVTKREIDMLVIAYPSCAFLDDGEKHLWARLNADKILSPPNIMATTADKGAIVSAKSLNWLDNLISLEELAKKIGVPSSSLSQMKEHYQESWLNQIKFKARMGVIP